MTRVLWWRSHAIARVPGTDRHRCAGEADAGDAAAAASGPSRDLSVRKSVDSGRSWDQLELEDIERKFLDARQGGYCFEHNSLFAAMLRDCGFAVAAFIGRVRRGPAERWARTHMVLKVGLRGSQASLGSPGSLGSESESWLADVGFGAVGLLEPIPLSDGATATQGGLTYSLRRESGLWILAMRDSAQEIDLYEFAEDPQTLGDVIVANHYTSTHPDSIFRRSLTIQTIRGDERITLRGDTISRYVGGVLHEQRIDRAQIPRVARDLFGVELPPGPFVYETYAAAV